MILLDTHAAIWLMTDEPALGPKSRLMAVAALEAGNLAISVISLWEVSLLVAKGRLLSVKSAADLRGELGQFGISEIALTGDIAILAVELPDLHGDPADRFIAASAIRHDATLVTADARLLGWDHAVKRQDARQ